MATAAEVNQAWHGGWREAQHHQLASDVAAAHAWATAVLAYWGVPASQRPDIVSGYRSPQRQAELRARWERGDRFGLTAKPALHSWHVHGRAVDVETHVSGFPWYAELLVRYTGARDGRTFNDPGHFDWPTP